MRGGFEEWRSGLKGAAGTSAGSVAALMLLLGLDREARRETLNAFSDMRVVVRCPDVSLLLRRFGWEDGTGFKEMVQSVLTKGGLSAESTLKDLRRLLRQDFVCVCTDLERSTPLLLSAATFPSMRVCDAVYASCCVPFMFTPMSMHDGRMVVDGCMTCNLPEVFDEEETLFVMLDTSTDERRRRIGTWVDFLQGIVRCSLASQKEREERLLSEQREKCIHVHFSPSLLTATPSFDVDLSADDVRAFVSSGYAWATDAMMGGALLDAVRGCVSAFATYAASDPPPLQCSDLGVELVDRVEGHGKEEAPDDHACGGAVGRLAAEGGDLVEEEGDGVGGEA